MLACSSRASRSSSFARECFVVQFDDGDDLAASGADDVIDALLGDSQFVAKGSFDNRLKHRKEACGRSPVATGGVGRLPRAQFINVAQFDAMNFHRVDDADQCRSNYRFSHASARCRTPFRALTSSCNSVKICACTLIYKYFINNICVHRLTFVCRMSSWKHFYKISIGKMYEVR